MSRFERFRQGWQAREPRERRMLAVMFAALGAFGCWYAVIAPLQRAEAAAQARYQRAAADLVEVQSTVRDIQALEAGRPAATNDTWADTVLETAAAAQVPISRQRTGDQGALTVGIDAVGAPALFAWFDVLRQQHGITPHALDVGERNGQLRVEMSFQPEPL